MNVCFVNTTDLAGGAERCSFDLSQRLRALGHDTSLVVGSKLSEDPNVYPCRYPASDWKPRAFLHHHLGLTDTTLVTPFRMVHGHPAFQAAEAINIHNMHGFYWNFWTVPDLARRRPVILTLHDEWLYTGDCVYTYDCDRWRDSCGSCPQMAWEIRPDLGGRDFTKANLFLKRAAMRLASPERVQIVSPSHWLAARTRQTVLGRFPISVIPNGIDLTRYRPVDRVLAKAKFGLPRDRFCFLFFSHNLEDPRKGFERLEKTLTRYGMPAGSVLLLAGHGAAKVAEKLSHLPIYVAGYLTGPESVAECFSAADCMLLLSHADNLPYVAIEACACGCPVLACDVGGIREIVEDGYNGKLLSPAADPEELAAGLNKFAALEPESWLRLSQQARDRAVERFSLDNFVRGYERLFLNAIQENAMRQTPGTPFSGHP